MENIEILVVGKHEQIMRTIVRLIDVKPHWKGSAAFSVEEATRLAQRTAFKVVLLGAGLSWSESDKLREYFKIPVVQHYGGGSGLLYAEIYEALKVK